MKRYICLFLAIMTLVLPLFSCASPADGNDTGDDPANTDAATEGSGTNPPEIKEELDIPDVKFADTVFTILTAPVESWNYSAADFDEPSEEPLDNAIYRRNLAVEELLGCDIQEVTATNRYEGITNSFKTDVDAGGDAYSVAFMNMSNCGTTTGAGKTLDLSLLEYVDLTKSWWDQASVKQLALTGRNFMVGSQILYSDKECLWLVFFIKDFISQFGLENPYELVEQNKWTWDKMLEMADAVDNDDNGDSKMTEEDTWGFCTHMENMAGMWMAAGEKLVQLDEDGEPYYTWNTERFFDVFEKIKEFMGTEDVVHGNSDKFVITAMAEARTLFAAEVVGWISGYRGNDPEFGLLPMPKYDTDQEDYYTYAAVNCDLMVVGKNCTDTYETGIILEALCAKGQEICLPVYYDEQLQSRYIRDEESSDMLDIVFKNRMYDLGVMFDWGSSFTNLKSVEANPSTLWSSLQKSCIRQMEKSLEKIRE